MDRLDIPEEVDGYRLGRKLGQGGQAVVYLGTKKDRPQVAVKLYTPGDGARGRRDREIQALRRVSAEYATEVISSGMVGGRPYLITRYIQGLTLKQLLEGSPGKRLAPRKAREVALGTITALAAFHKVGIVHRDFKPSNVICAPDHPHVIDFGIAKRVGDATTVGSGPIGTIIYMASERFSPGHAGPASDVFSWAVVMVEVMTGSHPFYGEAGDKEEDEAAWVIGRIKEEEPDLRGFPPRWQNLLRKCLHKNPDKRPQTDKVRETVRSLSAPVFTPPPAQPTQGSPSGSPARRPWHARRSRELAGLAAGAVLAGAVWGGTSLLKEVPACPQPLVLRAMAPAESREAFQRAAQEFAEDEAEAGDGCRPVQVVVSDQPSLEALRAGLANAWADRLRVDPQPDVILLDASAELAYVDPGSVAELPDGARPPGLENLGSTGVRSAISVVATAGAWNSLDAEDRSEGWKDLPSLLEQARENGVEVLRPSPDSAASGTLGSLGFYADPEVKDDAERLNAFERQVTRVPLADAGAALCALEERTEAVAIVPARVAAEYGASLSSGGSTGCGNGRRPTVFPSLRVDGLPRLDYPLVHVAWPGERAKERREYAGRFRAWLEGHAPWLAGQGPGGGWPTGSVALDPEVLVAVQDLLKRTRGGRTVEMLVDRSGSMELNAPGGVPLATARLLADDLMAELREHDGVGLAVFPGREGEEPEELLAHVPADLAGVQAVREQFEHLEADAETTPLYRALQNRAEALNAAEPAGVLVVFTDGDDDVSDDSALDVAFGVSTELSRDGSPRVVVVTLGDRCADGVRTLDEKLENVVCVAAGKSSYTDLRTMLFAEIWR